MRGKLVDTALDIPNEGPIDFGIWHISIMNWKLNTLPKIRKIGKVFSTCFMPNKSGNIGTK
jgi:hypothetical protein